MFTPTAIRLRSARLDLDHDSPTKQKAQREALPTWIPPQLAKLVAAVPDGAEWVHEIKHEDTACTPALPDERSSC
jgi:hypothetical protein